VASIIALLKVKTSKPAGIFEGSVSSPTHKHDLRW
jgi:hypothetical protein